MLDVSGSMAGEKLAAVRRAVGLLLQRLRATDRVTLVSFASDVLVHADQLSPKGTTGLRLAQEVATLQPRGSTNLSAGWLAAVGLCGAVADPARRRALVVLSDGQANEGIVSPTELAALCERPEIRSLPTTCVGVGADYSTLQLAAISDGTGGRFHHAATTEEILAVLAGELEELEQGGFHELEFGLEGPRELELDALGTGRVQRIGNLWRISLGALVPGLPRKFVFGLELPARLPGVRDELAVACSAIRASDGTLWEDGACLELEWSLAPGPAPSPADELLVVQRTAAWLRRRAAELNELGDLAQVAELRRKWLQALRQYAATNPQALAELDRLESELYTVQMELPPLERKELFVRGLKSSRDERDLRRR
ncbi:MAG: VWA domain-containing protein [Planctomycetota bacterium]|nr:VWA domain-containing protein [Planctomycetota bacterium]